MTDYEKDSLVCVLTNESYLNFTYVYIPRHKRACYWSYYFWWSYECLQSGKGTLNTILNHITSVEVWTLVCEWKDDVTVGRCRGRIWNPNRGQTKLHFAVHYFSSLQVTCSFWRSNSTEFSSAVLAEGRKCKYLTTNNKLRLFQTNLHGKQLKGWSTDIAEKIRGTHEFSKWDQLVPQYWLRTTTYGVWAWLKCWSCSLHVRDRSQYASVFLLTLKLD